MYLTVLIDFLRSFQNLEDALFGQCRGKNDREVDERCHTLTDSILESIDNLLVLVFHQVPLVHNYNKALVVALDELKDIHILRLDATGCIQHKDADIRVLDASDGTHDTVKFQILGHLVLAADAGSIDEIEVETELVVTGIDAVAGRTGNLGHDITVLADEGIDDARLAGVRTAYDGETGYVLVDRLVRRILQPLKQQVEQVACTAARSGTDTDGIAQTELIELGRLIGLAAVVHLVGDKKHRQLGTAENHCDILVPVGDTGLGINKEEHEVGLFSRHKHLLADRIFKNII